MDSEDTSIVQDAAQAIANYSALGMLARRSAATFIDFLILSFILFMLFIFLALVKLPESLYLLAFLFVVLGCLFYRIFLEGKMGQTIGKNLLEIKVVNRNFQNPGYLAASLRTLLRLFELNPIILIGFITIFPYLLSKKKQRLGDMIAETYVVHTSDVPDEKRIQILSEANEIKIIDPESKLEKPFFLPSLWITILGSLLLIWNVFQNRIFFGVPFKNIIYTILIHFFAVCISFLIITMISRKKMVFLSLLLGSSATLIFQIGSFMELFPFLK